MISIKVDVKTFQNTVISDRLRAVSALGPSAKENLVLT